MGAVVNSLVIIIASFIGLIVGQRISESLNRALMQGIGLVVITIGISGAIQGENILILITSMVIGILIGESLDIHGKVNQIVHRFGMKLKRNSDQSQLTQGFLSATMLFCIGSMAVVGSLESGLTGNNITLFTKTAIDGVSSILLASSLGVGVIFSSIPVFFTRVL